RIVIPVLEGAQYLGPDTFDGVLGPFAFGSSGRSQLLVEVGTEVAARAGCVELVAVAAVGLEELLTLFQTGRDLHPGLGWVAVALEDPERDDNQQQGEYETEYDERLLVHVRFRRGPSGRGF